MRGTALDRFGAAGGWRGMPAPRLRLLATTLGLLTALALHALVHGIGLGPAFWGAASGLAAALAAASLGLAAGTPGAGRLARFAAVGALVLALALPLGRDLARGEAMRDVLTGQAVWPQILVALFAGRLLAEENAARLAAFWRAPLEPCPGVSTQSLAAAIALGSALTLAFYGLVDRLPPASDGTSLEAVLGRALTGESAIHRAILFLLFVILAGLAEAALQQRRERAVLREIRAALGRADLGALRCVHPGDPARPAPALGAQTRAGLILRRAFENPGTDSRADAQETQAALHGAARRFLRGLLPILPLLGFLGTVVGLASAMAALPGDLGGPGRTGLTASLAGLALKFETTLLGILASVVASLGLGLLEAREAEFEAECRHVVAAARDAAETGHAP